MEDEGLLRGVGSIVLTKGSKRDFDEGLEVLVGSKKRGGGGRKEFSEWRLGPSPTKIYESFSLELSRAWEPPCS